MNFNIHRAHITWLVNDERPIVNERLEAAYYCLSCAQNVYHIMGREWATVWLQEHITSHAAEPGDYHQTYARICRNLLKRL